MTGGKHREVKHFGDGLLLHPQPHSFFGRLQVADPTGLIDLDVKSQFPGLYDQRKKLVAKVFAQQDARQKLAIVQCFILYSIARQARRALGF